MHGAGNDFLNKLLEVVKRTDWSSAEQATLARLMTLFLERESPPDPIGMFGQYNVLKQQFLTAVSEGDAEGAEESFLMWYCHVHGYEAPYSPAERATLDRLGGYWCHAGGISPLLKAKGYLSPLSVSVDLGAGNGLQGLLLQKLYPHRKAIQIELSSAMVAAGEKLQQWLAVPMDTVEWRVGDVRDFLPIDADFFYLYRPMRPEGPGRVFYRRLADNLDNLSQFVTIFSIADCLAPFLSDRFRILFSDGHLTILTNRPPPA